MAGVVRPTWTGTRMVTRLVPYAEAGHLTPAEYSEAKRRHSTTRELLAEVRSKARRLLAGGGGDAEPHVVRRGAIESKSWDSGTYSSQGEAEAAARTLVRRRGGTVTMWRLGNQWQVE